MVPGPCLESLFSHIPCKLPLSANKDHCAGRLNETRLIDTVALFFFYNNRPDICDQILVGDPFAKQRPQVMVVLAEQAGAELPIGGYPPYGAHGPSDGGHRRERAT